MTQDEFIERADKLWSGRFDYSLVEYVNLKTKVTIICSVHGKYKQLANAHLAGKECAKCAKSKSQAHMWYG